MAGSATRRSYYWSGTAVRWRSLPSSNRATPQIDDRVYGYLYPAGLTKCVMPVQSGTGHLAAAFGTAGADK
jgi:hypothetical protein